jgi:serine/threonine protein kinase
MAVNRKPGIASFRLTLNLCLFLPAALAASAQFVSMQVTTLANQRLPIDLLATHCGTPFFAAPELFVVKKYAGPPIDVWALGVVIYYVVWCVCRTFQLLAMALITFGNF